MSLDQHFHFVAAGQFLGKLGPAPGIKDTRYKHRAYDGEVYLKAQGVHRKILFSEEEKVKTFQSLIDVERKKRPESGLLSEVQGEPGTLPTLPNDLTGNGKVYSASKVLVDLMSEGWEPAGLDEIRAKYRRVVSRLQNVIVGSMPPVNLSPMRSHLESSDESAIRFRALSETLHELYGQAVGDHKKRRKEFKDGEMVSMVKWRSEGEVGVASLGSLVLVKVRAIEHVMTPEHFKRLIDLTVKFRNLSIFCRDLMGRERGANYTLMRLICRLGIKNQANVGAGFRVLRAYIMAKGADPSRVLSNVVRDSLEAFGGIKKEFGMEIIGNVEDLTDSYSELTQLGNLYKFILSPDISMQECFEAALGMKSPNRPTVEGQKKFRGLARKRTYLLSLKTGRPLHASSPDPDVQVEFDRPSPNKIALESLPLDVWAEVSFSQEAKFINYKDVKLRTNDKSSAVDLEIEDMSELSSYNLSWLRGGEPDVLVYGRPKKRNDVMDELESGDGLNPRVGFRRFKRLVAKHRKLESRLMEKYGYLSLDDIPSELLAKEILKTPELRYTVNTEPKEGEFHKPAGRLFYMATKEMKSFISSIERLCRTVFHGQVGNSILSSYSRRSSQLRKMANETQDKASGFDLYFTSFDMSEFSKKFPMGLVREIGEIFAELTGDEEVSRLDIIFRAGLIVHSTSGFEGVFSGVRGGFEGFLNFVWTSAHVTVMELALMETQKQGVVMAYSDDGLLEFIVSSETPMDERRDIVLSIQQTYSSLGLTFHLYKTLVATNVFEYLGLVAKDGRFMESWGKPLANLGISDRRASFTPFNDIVQQLTGQASAIISSLCPLDMVYYHYFLEVVLLIERRCSRLTCDQAICIAVTPLSMGGLGIPFPMRMSVTDETSGLGTFLSSCQILYDSGLEEMKFLMNELFETLHTGEECLKSIILGEEASCDMPRLDAQGLLNRISAIAAAKAGKEEVENPLNEFRVRKIGRILKCMSNIPSGAISSVIKSTPKMQDYESWLGVATSRGAFNFVGRKTIQTMQKRDSKKVSNALLRWSKVFSACRTRSFHESITGLYHKISKNHRSFGLTPPRLSPLAFLILTRNPKDALVAVTLRRNAPDLLGNPKRSRKLDDAIYQSEEMTSGAPDSMPVFDSVESVSKVTPDKMVKACGRFISSCPNSYNHLVELVWLLGGQLPSVEVVGWAHLERIRALSRGKPSLLISMPQTTYALTIVDSLHEMSSAVRRGEVTDNSSLTMYAKVLMGIYADRYGFLSSPPKNSSEKFYLRVTDRKDISAMLYVRSPKVVRPLPVDLCISRVEATPISVHDPSVQRMGDYLKEVKMRLQVLDTGQGGEEYRQHLVHAIASRMSKKISARIRSLPESALIGDTRYVLDGMINDKVEKVTYMEVARITLPNNGEFPNREVLREYLEKVSNLAEELPEFMSRPSMVDVFSNGDYVEYLGSSEVASLFEVGNRKATIIGDTQSPSAYRDCLQSTIRSILVGTHDASSPIRWEGRYVIGGEGGPPLEESDEIFGGSSVDEIMDMVYAINFSLRESPHRTTPYNRTTVLISYLKMACISYRKFGTCRDQRGNRKALDQRLQTEVLTANELHLVRSTVQRITRDELGPDHMRILRMPVGPYLVKRIRAYSLINSARRPRWMYGLNDGLNTGFAGIDADNLRHKIYQAINIYMIRNTVQVSTTLLRSSEALNYFTGSWQTKRLIVNSVDPLSESGTLYGGDEGTLIALQALELRRKVFTENKGLGYIPGVNIDHELNRHAQGKMERCGVIFPEPGEEDAMRESGRICLEAMPEEGDMEEGKVYVYKCESEVCSDVVRNFARLGSFGEMSADIVRREGRFILLAVIYVTNTPVTVEIGDSDASLSISTYSMSSVIAEDDAEQMVSGGIRDVCMKRKSDIGVDILEDDEEDTGMEGAGTAPLSLEGNIGIERRGTYMGRVISGERGLHAATYLCHALSSDASRIWGAAIAHASIVCDPDEHVEHIIFEASRKVTEWTTIINEASGPAGRYVVIGVNSEIAAFISWLRRQNFIPPTNEGIDPRLVDVPRLDTYLFRIALRTSINTGFVNSNMDLCDVRELYGARGSLQQVLDGGPILSDDEEAMEGSSSNSVESDNGTISEEGQVPEGFRGDMLAIWDWDPHTQSDIEEEADDLSY